jgi:hypothetical protein
MLSKRVVLVGRAHDENQLASPRWGRSKKKKGPHGFAVLVFRFYKIEAA